MDHLSLKETAFCNVCLMVFIGLTLTTSSVAGQFYPGPVPQYCLECICLTESKCQPLPCRFDVTSDACGYFQIHEGYWLDCGKPGVSWKACSVDKMCSSQCVQQYMKRYATKNCPATCEGYAREHNGGRRGCDNPATLPYWNRVKQQTGCHNVGMNTQLYFLELLKKGIAEFSQDNNK